MKSLRKLSALAAAAAVLILSLTPRTLAQPTENIVDIALSDPNFSTLVTALQTAGLVEALQADGPFTVFAPSNEAFAKVPTETLNALLADPAALSQVLLYHVVPNRVRSTDLVDGTLVTLQGAAATIDLSGGVMIDNANVVAADVEASNGIIHVIDEVILPPGSIVDIALSDPNFSTLVTALQTAGLVEALQADGPFTVFAPSNEAFAKVPTETLNALLADPAALSQVLLYHVVRNRVRSTDLVDGTLVTLQGAAATIDLSGGVMIDNANVVAADVEASNGIIHVIDEVILPPGSIVDIALSDPNFSTLVTALQTAGLVEALQADGPFTVFAPSNEAFAKVPTETLNALLADPAALSQVLLYHVVPNRVRSTDLVDGTLVTLQGAAATIDLSGGVMIDNANVVAADVEASNGIIHVIDEVILPPGSIVDIALSDPNFSTLVTALQTAGLVEALQADGPFTVFAPSNEAFAKVPTETLNALLADPAALSQVLLYHVVRNRVRSTDLVDGTLVTLQGAAATIDLSGGVMIDNANVVAADVEASNGIIHVIDEVILPPGSIVDIALSDPNFSTLVTALQTAGLVEALQADGPFTVFAPNNEAFAKLPTDTLDALLADPARLAQILLYHVNHGPRLRSGDLQTGKVSTMQGSPIRVVVDEQGVMVNQATVLSADIEALNGVIHVIDEVILPVDGLDSRTLSATGKAGTLTLVWPDSPADGFILESADAPSGPWSSAAETGSTLDGVTKVEINTTGGKKFYRLRSTNP